MSISNRSPGLMTLSGCAGILVSLVSVFRVMLGISTEVGGDGFDLLLVPIMLTLFTGAYVMRGCRLLVMYNPHLRNRWGRYSKEPFMMRALVASCVVLEGVVWIACSIFGTKRSGFSAMALFIIGQDFCCNR